MEKEIERLNDNGELSAILDLSHPILVPYERDGYVFVWAECGECCGWIPRHLNEMGAGEWGCNLAGEVVVRMADADPADDDP